MSSLLQLGSQYWRDDHVDPLATLEVERAVAPRRSQYLESRSRVIRLGLYQLDQVVGVPVCQRRLARKECFVVSDEMTGAAAKPLAGVFES